MGLYIIRELMSEVDYHRGCPNVLSMRKELMPKDAPALRSSAAG